MITFELTVFFKLEDSQDEDSVSKVIQWPVLPREGDELDICNPGYAGGPTAKVSKVKHWFGLLDPGQIEVQCALEGRDRGDLEILRKDGFN